MKPVFYLPLPRILLPWIFSCTLAAAVPGRGEERPVPPPASEPPFPSLTVRGQGEVSVAPDQALVRVGVEAGADDAVTAQNKINTAMHQAIDRIHKVGIPSAAIQTSGVSLQPVYAGAGNGSQTITGYRASNVIRVRVDDLSLLGKAIDAAVAAGANRIEGVTFQLKHDLPERTRALQMAVEEARAKAKAMAAGLGVRLGPVAMVSEEGAVVVPPRPFLAAETMVARSTPVQAGEIRVQASVTVSYQLGGETGSDSSTAAAERGR